MQTSQQWWENTKSSQESLVAWLRKQYHGEITAAERIEKYCLTRSPDGWKPSLRLIAEDERRHAMWVGALLKARGVQPSVLEKEERYWDKTLSNINSFESAAAVAAHAENMRLERINVISDDVDAPDDIRQVFKAILKDERFHAEAFRHMAGSEELAKALEAHLAGSQEIGLINLTEVL